MRTSIHRVTITGACGNLGWKILCHLVQQVEIEQVFGVDLQRPGPEQLRELSQLPGNEKAQFTQADLTNHADHRWRDPVRDSHAVLHFAAQNPFPEATWNDANHSLDMTINIASLAAAAGVRRFVFASSNHVMGRYKDRPLSQTIGVGELATSLEHAVGTVWKTGDTEMDSTVYAVAKSSGERVCRALSLQSGGSTEFVCTRIGWCQPGENHPSTLSGAGTPTQDSSESTAEDREAAKNDRWFKSMWLSNRDFVQLHARALFADSIPWPDPCIVVNAMSRNDGMPWSLNEAQTWLGYEPQDGIDFSAASAVNTDPEATHH